MQDESVMKGIRMGCFAEKFLGWASMISPGQRWGRSRRWSCPPLRPNARPAGSKGLAPDKANDKDKNKKEEVQEKGHF
jgi:hypothetical protein